MRLGKNKTTRLATTAVVLSVALWGVSGCSTDTRPVIESDEEDLPAIVETTPDTVLAERETEESFTDYTGVYDEEFYDDVEFYVGEEVTVAAIVGEVISPNVFTIVDAVNSDEESEDVVDIDEVIIEPLLIVHDQEIAGLTPGQPVGVVGVVREEFSLATIEGELGVDLDLDEEDFEERDEKAYIEVTEASAMSAAGS